MSKQIVEALSSQTLLMGLVRLSHTEGESAWGRLSEFDAERPARMAMMRDELLRRLKLQQELSLEAQHVVAHLEVLASENPELAGTLVHVQDQLGKLSKQPFGNYLG